MNGQVIGPLDHFFYDFATTPYPSTYPWILPLTTVGLASGTITASAIYPHLAGTASTAIFEAGGTSPVTCMAVVGVWNSAGALLYQSANVTVTSANTVYTASFSTASPVSWNAFTVYFVGIVFVGATTPGIYGQSHPTTLTSRGNPFNLGVAKVVLTASGYTGGTLPGLSSAGSITPYIEFT